MRSWIKNIFYKPTHLNHRESMKQIRHLIRRSSFYTYKNSVAQTKSLGNKMWFLIQRKSFNSGFLKKEEKAEQLFLIKWVSIWLILNQVRLREKNKTKRSITCAVHVIPQKLTCTLFPLSPNYRLYSTHSLLGLGFDFGLMPNHNLIEYSQQTYIITIIVSVFCSLLSYTNQPKTEKGNEMNLIQLLTPIIWLTLSPGNAVSAFCYAIL